MASIRSTIPSCHRPAAIGRTCPPPAADSPAASGGIRIARFAVMFATRSAVPANRPLADGSARQVSVTNVLIAHDGAGYVSTT